MLIEVNEQNFSKEILESRIPVIVEFWAPWCSTCQSVVSIVEEASKELEGKAKVCRVNVDDNPSAAANYEVMSIPMFILFMDGKIVDQQIGALSKEMIIGMIKK